MARYAIGDIQGCLEPLKRLLAKIQFDPAKDVLWLVGDLVNRGPDSLETLQYLYPMRDALKIVLGNHDLHLLALFNGVSPGRKDAGLRKIIDSPDADSLCNWLSQQPLVYAEDDWLMVHAGLHPQWSSEQALAFSAEVEAAVRGSNSAQYFTAMYGDKPDLWKSDIRGMTRLRVITNYLTRMRICNSEARLHLRFKDELTNIPGDFKPWFEWPSVERKQKIVFGHWAALRGCFNNDKVLGLDTGCVWGDQLTAANLDTGEIHQCSAYE